MGRPEETTEPSMDEILASIRKIISEDPSDPRRPQEAMPARPLATPQGAGAIPFGTPEPARHQPSAAAPNHHTPQRPARAVAGEAEDDLSDILEGPPRTPVLPAANSGPASPAELNRPSWRFSRDAASSSPPPVEARADSRGGGRPIGPLSDSIELLRNSRRAPAANADAAPPVEEPRRGSSDTDFRKPESDRPIAARAGRNGLETPRDLKSDSDKVHAAAVAELPLASGPITQPAARSAMPTSPFVEAAAAAVAALPVDSAPLEAEQAAAAARSALGVLAAGLAEASMPTSSAPAASMIASHDGPKGGLIKAAENVTPPASNGAQPARTLEDAVADMLRPMLREWLDTNMPRIVEKAISVEMADKARARNGR